THRHDGDAAAEQAAPIEARAAEAVGPGAHVATSSGLAALTNSASSDWPARRPVTAAWRDAIAAIEAIAFDGVVWVTWRSSSTWVAAAAFSSSNAACEGSDVWNDAWRASNTASSRASAEMPAMPDSRWP